MFPTRRSRPPYLVSVVLFALATLGSHAYAIQTPTDLFFSEYVEGSSWNKALEIYNGTGAAIDLAAGGYAIQYYTNGSATASGTINLAGTVPDREVYVVANPGADTTVTSQADLINPSLQFNGNDAIALVRVDTPDITYIDVIGQIGFDPGPAWVGGAEPELVSTLNMTLRRKSSIFAGDPNGADTFDPPLEWNGFPANTFDGLGTHAVVPIPPTVYLMGSGLLGVIGIKRRRGRM